MKQQDRIPTSKIQRASRFVKTGMKVGGNYLKHYAKKAIQQEVSEDELNQDNAEAIYDTLSELKGSALKVAQMLSMDKGVLPEAFSTKFAQAQHKAPPLSGPLIVKIFNQYFGMSPLKLYDKFEMQAAHAASIGQVHQAEKDGKKIAVKVQYPGVADSVVSDLNMVKPFAKQMFGWKEKDLGVYFDEVQDMLLEETDYELELERSAYISQACNHLPNLFFATYYPDYSSKKVISMDWLEGMHMDQFLASNPSQEVRNKAGQALWDFYNFQVHELKTMHADAHPGNFLFREDGSVGILDFGCVKQLPEDFYQNYFRLLQPGVMDDEEAFRDICLKTSIIYDFDTPEEEKVFMGMFRDALEIVCKPFYGESFDFGDETYFNSIYDYGEQVRQSPIIRKTKAPRGAKDGIYMNRAYFGLYSILNALKSEVKTQSYMPAL
ncbi:MAG: AarF/ABC1/UbiB kinase family protein [Bacteroidota bacterium]